VLILTSLFVLFSNNTRVYVDKEDPDILCLQETKVGESDGATECLGDKYHKAFYAAVNPNSGYAGTGYVVSRVYTQAMLLTLSAHMTQ